MDDNEESVQYYGYLFVSAVLDPIPGPETIGPSLDGPDIAVYRHSAGAGTQSSDSRKGIEDIPILGLG